MTALIRPVARRKILPRRTGAQYPQHSVQNAARLTPAPAAPVRSLPALLIPLHERLNILPLHFAQIGHAFYLRQI